jgi:hypothetical protein
MRSQLSVGAKHLEDKLSIIAKDSSPNASPVQLSVVRKKISPLLPSPLLWLPHIPFLSLGIIDKYRKLSILTNGCESIFQALEMTLYLWIIGLK